MGFLLHIWLTEQLHFNLSPRGFCTGNGRLLPPLRFLILLHPFCVSFESSVALCSPPIYRISIISAPLLDCGGVDQAPPAHGSVLR
jgi:hypothetical protein